MNKSKYDYYYEMRDKRLNYGKNKIDWDAIILRGFLVLAIASFILFSFINFLANRGA